MMREPAVAGAFYPGLEAELKSMIKKFLLDAPIKDIDVKAIVSPHAGYIYCGKTAAAVYKIAKGNFDTAVILGPNHSGVGAGVATYSGVWNTPLGNVEVDEEFARALAEESIIMEDNNAHIREHSIEVQLPWLQYRFRGFKFVPIAVNPIYFDIESSKEIGEKIAEVSKRLNRKILIIASSDFTHFGSMYGYEPFSGSANEILRKIKVMDMGVVRPIVQLNPEIIIEKSEGKTVCGYGGIAAMVYAARLLGATKGVMADYSTSYDVSRDLSAIVAYAGILIY